MSDKFLDDIEKKYLRDEQVEPWESGELGRDSEHARVSSKLRIIPSIVANCFRHIDAIITKHIGVMYPIKEITVHPKVFDRLLQELDWMTKLELPIDGFDETGPIVWNGMKIYRGDDDE